MANNAPQYSQAPPICQVSAVDAENHPVGYTLRAVHNIQHGQANIELVKVYSPADDNGIQRPLANTHGIRHIAFVVDDIEAIVAKLKKRGTEMFSEIQTYEDSYKLCYIRGPEGIILELAQHIG